MNGTTYTTTASQNPGTYGPVVQYNTVASTGVTDGTGGTSGGTLDPSQSTLSPNFASYVYDMLSRGQGLANLPYQEFTGQRFAFQTTDPTTGQVVGGYSPLEQEAFTGYKDLKAPDAFTTAASNLSSAATSAGQQKYSPTTFTSGFTYDPGQFDIGFGKVGELSSYETPYMQGVVEIAKRKAQEDAALKQRDLAAKFSTIGGGGAFGGSRYAIESGMAAKALQEQLGDIQIKGLQSAYESAVKRRQDEAKLYLDSLREAEGAKQFEAKQAADFGLEAQKASDLSKQFEAKFGLDTAKAQADIAEALSRTGTAQTAAERSVLQDLMTAGTRQREIAQQPLDFGYQQFQESMKYPYQQATFLQSLLQGMPIQAAQYQSGESPLMTALIGLLTGAGLLPKEVLPKEKTTTNSEEETTTNNAQGGEVKAKYAVGGQVMAPQMGGIRALMPGQAGSFSAVPTPQGQTPPSMVGPLSQMSPDQLQAMYNDPNNTYPKWAVASAYADSIDKLRRAQQYQGQQATQANIQEQQKVPVADQVMSVQAASGGLMKSFDKGGSAKAGASDPISVLQELQRTLEAAEKASRDADEALQRYGLVQRQADPEGFRAAGEKARQAQAALDQARRAFRAGPAMTAGVPEVKPLAPITQPAPALPAARSEFPSAPVVKEQASAPRVQTPSAERPIAGLTAIQPSKDYAALLESDTEALRKQVMARAQRSPEEIEARQKEDQARALLQQQRMANMRAAEAESGRQLKDLERRAATPLFGDRMDFLKLAAAIDPRGGFSGVAKGLGSLVKEREALRDTAMKESASLVDKMRLLRLQYQEAEALEAERQRARITGDKEALRNADVEAAKLNVEMRKLQSDIVSRQQDIDVRRESVAASREGTAAQREGTRLNMLTQRQLDRERVVAAARKRFEEDTNIKMAKQMADRPGAKPEDKQKYQDMLKRFKEELDAELAPIDESISRLRELSGLGAAPAAAQDMSRWGQMTVTESKQ